MWLSLENLLQEKLPSDSILIAWLIRHAAWSLTRFQVKNDGRTAFVRVFGKAYTSQVLPFGERVMYKCTAMGHGMWVGKAPMTDEHTILTENGVQKATSLHRVPLEERFVISELRKVRGLPWNGRAENLKATIVTQQDQGPSGHRRVYLTTKVVARLGATLGCSGCVGLGPHNEACRARLEKALADEEASAGPVGAGVGPIAEPDTEPQQPAPTAQQEPASSPSGLAAPMLTQNHENEQLDSPMELGAQERSERKGARPNETPSSEISDRPVVKARPASPPTIVPTAEGSGTIVLSASASSSKDEMMTGGLYVIDGIDVVATLVPEEDARQFDATETCTTETQLRDREQESIAVVNYEDPSTSEAIEAYDARTGERLDSEEVRKGRAKEVRELDEFEVKMEVDESEMQVENLIKMGGDAKGSQQPSNTVSAVCHRSQHG